MNIKEVLQKLTIEEKIALTSGKSRWEFFGVERLNIKPIVTADGPHGIRVYERDEEGKLILDKQIPSTLFPCAASMASTFNDDLIFQVGSAIGDECNMHEVDILLAPGVNLKRSPLGGRNFEYYSEDPYLSGRMATAYIKGVQSKGVGTCIKHFALNEQETQRRFVDTIIDERTLFEHYLMPFKMAFEQAKPYAVMSAYNKVNGNYASESKELLKDILIDKLGFDGVVISDWSAVQNKVKSIKNGLNIEMPGPSDLTHDVMEAYKKNEISEQEIDESLVPLFELYQKLSLNTEKGLKANMNHNHKVAQKVAEEAIVLLENDGILPLKKQTKVCVVGDFAQNPRINGGGSAKLIPYIKETPLEELSKYFDVTFSQGYIEEDTNEEMIQKVITSTKDSDVIVFFSGTTEKMESEGFDRANMDLPVGHIELFEVLKQQNKPIVTLLNNGSALDLTPIEDSNAVIEAWFLGGANGLAIAKILCGEINPSGRLSETIPYHLHNTPHYGSFPVKQDEIYYHGDILKTGYRYYDNHNIAVRYPFGYGLSYASFEYSNIRINKTKLHNDEVLTLTIDVKNTSKVFGKEVVQLYVGDPESYFPKPIKELKNYKKVMLEPGESKSVTFEVSANMFKTYSPSVGDYRIEPGLYHIMIGKNVNAIEQSVSVMVTNDAPFRDNLKLHHPLKTFMEYKPGVVEYIKERGFDKFPWYFAEHPAIRVLRRFKKQYNLNDEEYQELENVFKK